MPFPMRGTFILPMHADVMLAEARQKRDLAESNYKIAESALEENYTVTQQALDQLGKLKVEVFTHQIKHLASVIQQKKSVCIELSGYDEKIEIKKNFGIVPFEEAEPSSIVANGAVNPEKFFLEISGSSKHDCSVQTAIAQIDAINAAMKDIRTAVDKQTAVIMVLTERFDEAKVDSIDDPGADKMLMTGMSLIKVLMEHVLSEDVMDNPNISSQRSGYLEISLNA